MQGFSSKARRTISALASPAAKMMATASGLEVMVCSPMVITGRKRDTWDVDKTFGCGKIDECATFIYEDMRKRWKEFVQNKEECGLSGAVKILDAQIEKWYKDAKKRDEEYENEGK